MEEIFPPPPPPLVDSHGNQLWIVEALLNHKDQQDGVRTSYLVRWRGYPPSADSWEPRMDLLRDVPDSRGALVILLDLTCTFLSFPRFGSANLRSAESACASILTTFPHRKRLDSYVRNLWRRKYTRRFWSGHV